MKVLVIGSMRRPDSDANVIEFRRACHELGRALVTAGHEVVVSSDDPETVDPHVVAGVASAEGNNHRVWLVLPNDGSAFPFSDQAKYRDHIEFFLKRLNDESWGMSRVSQIEGVDAVIALGGGYGTAMTAQLAAAMQRPVLPIPRFHGASEDLWRSFKRFFDRLGMTADKVGTLEHEWTETNAIANAHLAVDVLRELAERRVFRSISVTPQQLVLLVAVVVFMTGWIAIFWNSLTQGGWTFIMAFLATGLGTSLRNSLRLVFDPAAQLSWFQLLNDWTAGIVLGFALCLLYFVGAVAVTGSTEQTLTPPKTGDFQRIAIIMTLLGMTGGLLLEQVADGLRSWLIDRLPARPQK